MANSIFPQRSRYLANYDWIDLVSGTGYILFDGMEATNKILVEVQSISLRGSGAKGSGRYDSSSSHASSTYYKLTDIDFDSSELQLPRTIEGKMIVRCGFVSYNTTASATYTIKTVARLRKWDGSNETEIATAYNESGSGTTGDAEFSESIDFDVPKTHFKKGETIRLTIELWCKDTAGTQAVQLYLGFWPEDGAITITGPTTNLSSGNSRLIAIIPFKLDFM